MSGRRAAALATSAAAVAMTLAACGEAERNGAARGGSPAQGAPHERPRGVVWGCAKRSEATFPAFSDQYNVVVGPLVLVGAAHTPASTVREFGGNKFPALVKAGHRVTIAVSRRTYRVASLGYGPLPQAVELTPRDGHRVVTFIACPRSGPSGSTAGGEPVTFWSGFVLTASPRCVPIEVWVDDEPSPRRTTLRMGVPRCP